MPLTAQDASQSCEHLRQDSPKSQPTADRLDRYRPTLLGTKWGLFRYYWVLFAFVMTSLATVVLVLHMPDVSAMSEAARTADGSELEAMGGDLFHAVLGLAVLLVILVLNIYKPPGMTRYGWRHRAGSLLD